MNASDRPFEIRLARPEDAGTLASLLEELGFPADAGVIAERLADLAALGETVLVGVRDGAVLGVITLHVTPVLHRPTPVGRVTMLVVSSRVRGAGLGRALVATAEKLLAEEGCALVEVTSNRALTGAHAFYEKLGYEATSVRFHKSL